MRKLSKNSKAVVGAATFLLFAFAGAQAGSLHLQLERLDSSALRAQGLSAPAALHRLPAKRSQFKLLKDRRPAGHGIADAPLTSLAQGLHFAGVRSGEVASANEPLSCAAALPRAPPLS